jgi:vitamin B12 transporter
MNRHVAVLLWLAGANALAQDHDLETLLVTASRTPVALGETGSAVSVLTREDLERRDAVSLADVLRDVPGIALSRSGPFGAQAQIRVRGAEANHVLVLIDGVEANDPAAGDEFQFEHLLADDIERVEIVRGPQSALWGSDALGGVINVITRHGADAREASGRIEGGSYGTVHAGAHLAFGKQRFGVGLSAAHFDTDGTNVSETGSEADGYRNDTFDIAAHVDSPDSARFEIAARQTHAATQSDAVDFRTGLPADADRTADSTQRYFRAGASFRPAESSSHDVKVTYLDTATSHFAAGAPDGATAADKLGLYYQTSLRLRGPSHQTLTLAVDHERSRFLQRGLATPFGDPNQTQSLDTTGYAAEYHVSPSDGVDVFASARYDDNSAFESATTYRLSASYLRPGGRTHLRASVGTAQKAPTFIDRFGYFPDVYLGNPDLEPEMSRGWEIGADQPLGRATFRATLFAQDLTNEIDPFVFDASAGQFTARNQDGISHRRGLELELSAAPTSALTLNASYTYTESTEPDGAGGQRPEIRRPRNTAAFDIDYAPSAKTNLNVDIAYSGTRYDTFFAPPPQPAQQRRLGAYRLISVAGSYRLTRRIQFVGHIENLLDEQYEDVIGFATPGISVYAGVRVSR